MLERLLMLERLMLERLLIIDNRFRTSFTLLGRTFISVDQYFVWQKARYFGDFEIASEVLMINNPVTIRRIGYKVRNFVKDEWDSVRVKANLLRLLN